MNCPENPCFSCAERAESKQCVAEYIAIWKGNPPPNGMVCDPAPKHECKQHEGYGAYPEETREVCREYRAA